MIATNHIPLAASTDLTQNALDRLDLSEVQTLDLRAQVTKKLGYSLPILEPRFVPNAPSVEIDEEGEFDRKNIQDRWDGGALS